MIENNYDLIEHLKLIEQQVQRMADNSFKIKNWAITIIGGGLLYWLKGDVAKQDRHWLIGLILLATCMFWWLDAYYLTLEKCYRELYLKAQNGEESSYNLSIREFLNRSNIMCTAITSKSFTHTYLLLLFFEIALFMYKYVKW